MAVKGQLNEKQRRFCIAYSKCANASEAAREAGYSKRNANVAGSYLLTNPNIQLFLASINRVKKASDIADMDQIKRVWTSILNDTSARQADRIRAGEMLAKTYGAFIEKIEVKQVESSWYKDNGNDTSSTAK